MTETRSTRPMRADAQRNRERVLAAATEAFAVEGEDVWCLPDGPEWREAVGKMLNLVIDGLRYGASGRR